MAITRPKLIELVNRLTADVESSTGYGSALLPVSVLRVLAKTFAGSIHMLYGFAQYMSSQIFPDTAEAAYLDRWGAVWGVTRLAATFAGCDLTVTGQNGSTIPAGTLWIATNGMEYESAADATIAGGTASIPVSATTSGTSGNVSAGQTIALVSPVAGVNGSATVANAGVVDAQDAEADASLLTRILARIQHPPQGGAQADYEAWARSIAGVTRAWAFSNWQGPGTVGLTFVLDGSADPIPDADTVSTVSDYIESVRPVTANVTVFAPTNVPVNVTIALTSPTDAIKEAIESALSDYIGEYGYPGQTLYVTRMIQTISENSGSSDFTLSIPAANIVLTNSQFATMGVITWA